ncbi:MAG: CoA ester lyase, partial [Brachymonas sp.]|nr:CoA ester lyase [Brachymonas sp.]
ISFGLMDFVSSHAGAIPSEAMQVDGQFSHPLVVQAKLQIASACHAYGKTPSHCVVTEFKDDQAIARAATQAARQFGYTRMWSIHPSQVRPILAAFSPDESAVQQAAEIIEAGYIVDWAPINHNNRLHDRASYRFYWHVLERAHATGKALPCGVQALFSGQGAAPQPPHTPW